MFKFEKHVIINHMKILFITDLYPIKEGERTTPLALHNFVIEWIKQGHEVDVIKPNFIFNSFLRGKPFYNKDFYDFEGVKIFNVNYFTPFLGNVTKKLPDSIDVGNYDVIISHMPSGTIFADKLAKKFNKPLVCGVHHSDIEILIKPIYKFYFREKLVEAYKNSKKIACRSFILQKKFGEILPECARKCFVAASGVEIDAKMQRCKDAKQKRLCHCEERSDEAIQNGSPFTIHHSPFTVLTCANLIKRKNIDKLIMAVKDLDGFELKIIGDGKELKNLKRMMVSLAHQQKINFLGRLEHEKALEEMQNSDIFILPSVNETFGLVYLEAMASGCITVCTKNDGIDEIIKDNENGFLTEPTVEGIKQTLLRIKNNDNLEQILSNSLETIKNYTSEICAKKYLNNLMD